MSEINFDELQEVVLTLEDEDGKSVECSMQGVFEYKGQDFAVLAEEDNPNNEVYFFLLNSKQKKDETEYEFTLIDDDELLEELLIAFQHLVDKELSDEDFIEYPDADDHDEPDEDDHIWDEFITKKLDQ